MRKMKQLALIAITLMMTATLAACSGGVAAPSYSTPWTSGGNVYEQSTYHVTRDKVGGEKGAYTYTTVAEGTQTVTVRKGTEADTISMTTERELTYVQEDDLGNDKKAAVGAKISYSSEIVFSSAANTMMQVLSSKKKIVNEAEPNQNLDYTATYSTDSGLKIVNGEDTYTFKYSKVKNAFDNDMWYFLVRYGADFGKGWSNTLKLISIADTIYSGGVLSIFSMSATAGSKSYNQPLTTLTENIQLGANDFVAQTNEETDTLYAPAVDVTMTQPGDMGSIRGPAIRASFITDRKVDRLQLANLMLDYQQNEFLPNGTQTYRNFMTLSGASIRE